MSFRSEKNNLLRQYLIIMMFNMLPAKCICGPAQCHKAQGLLITINSSSLHYTSLTCCFYLFLDFFTLKLELNYTQALVCLLHSKTRKRLKLKLLEIY